VFSVTFVVCVNFNDQYRQSWKSYVQLPALVRRQDGLVQYLMNYILCIYTVVRADQTRAACVGLEMAYWGLYIYVRPVSDY
jgi:hypothetical protein